jgi:hypothetical protein
MDNKDFGPRAQAFSAVCVNAKRLKRRQSRGIIDVSKTVPFQENLSSHDDVSTGFN